jgi:hypothetical protein
MDPGIIRNKALDKQKENKRFLDRLRKKPPRDLDVRVRMIHNEVFSRINCLDCANCCKSIGPFLRDRDIDRIAASLGLKPSGFTERYLRLDVDEDYVFRNTPCPFLLPDNYCSVYTDRPGACREYPHTDRKNFHQVLKLTLKNAEICPAVQEIIEGLKKVYGLGF